MLFAPHGGIDFVGELNGATASSRVKLNFVIWHDNWNDPNKRCNPAMAIPDYCVPAGQLAESPTCPRSVTPPDFFEQSKTLAVGHTASSLDESSPVAVASPASWKRKCHLLEVKVAYCS